MNEASPLAEIQAPHAIDCEEALLGAILHNPAALDGVRGLVDVSDFYQQANAVLFEAMCARRDAGEHIDIKLVKTAVGDQDLGGVTVFQYLARIAAEAATVINAPGYAKAIRDAARMRTIFETARSAIDAMTSGAITDPGEYASWMIQELDSVVTSGQSRSVKRMRLGDSAASVLERVREAQAGRIRKGATFGLPSLDRATLGMRDDQLIIMAGRPGMGKAQPLDAKVHTPHGWRLMGELAVGDIISSIDGAPSSVMGVFDQGVKPVFRIRFSDGRETRCCADHLWEVSYRSWPSARIVSTTQLIELLSKVRYRGRISVRMHSGNIGNCADLPLHPWLLGVILGDGGLTGDSIGVCLPDAAIRDQVSALLPDGYSLSQRSGIDYIIRSETPGRNGVKAALTDLGLMGLRSEEKRIPRCYLDGDRAQRLALLQGLLDTDGWVERQGSVRFSSSSPGLTADVVELCRSLGLWAKSSVKAAYVGSIGAGRVRKLDAHQVCITGPGVAEVFTLERKAERLLSRTWFRSLTIESVTEDGIAPCRCIAVSHPSHLYVTDDHVVTHNTTAALHVAIAAARAGYGTGFISLEMNDIELAERALAGAAYNSRDPISYRAIAEGSKIDEAAYRRLDTARRELDELPFEIEQQPGLTVAQIASRARNLRTRFERQGMFLGLLVIDHIGLISPSKRYSGNRVQEMTEISGSLKRLAKELGIPVLALSQLNRVSETRTDKRPILSDLRDSGSIEQDADVVIGLFREAYYLEHVAEPTPEQFDRLEKVRDTLEIEILKQRSGPTIRVECFCDVSCNALAEIGR